MSDYGDVSQPLTRDVDGDSLLGHPSHTYSRGISNLDGTLEVDVEEAPIDNGSWRRRPGVFRIFDNSLKRMADWIQGPRPPRTFILKPWCPSLSFTLRSSRHIPNSTAVLIGSLCALWALLFGSLLLSSVQLCSVDGYGQPTRLSCASRFWKVGHTCGVDGALCRPFDNFTAAFRCPANCGTIKALDTYYVGNEDVVYRNIVIGPAKGHDDSDAVYRGDSFICGAALHAGLISNVLGGSVVVSLAGESHNYTSVLSHGVHSIGFAPEFPQSFKFLAKDIGGSATCRDPRWILLIISVLITSTIALFTDAAAIFFWTSYIIAYLTVALATDPPEYTDYGPVITSAFMRLLPAAFIGIVVYQHWISITLKGLAARAEKTVLWLGGCWIGSLNNFTFDNLPLSRLTPHDLSQPGAILTLIVLVLIIYAIALGQVWVLRIEGRLPQYLKLYGILSGILLFLAVTPRLHLRLHHYILALLLLPGTAVQTRPSLLYQGLLLGLFISGIARWGFAGILETSALLYRNGPFDGPVPSVAAPQIAGNSNILFDLSNVTAAAPDNRFSILVNDVERFRTPLDATWAVTEFNWTRSFDKGTAPTPTFFRMAYVYTNWIGRDLVGRYTNPGTWFANGTWRHFEI